MKTNVDKGRVLAGRDIAIPGSEMYDTLENLGIEEEEYSFYSLNANGQMDSEEDSEEKIALNYHWYLMTIEGDRRKTA
jgi:hypothetical protein